MHCLLSLSDVSACPLEREAVLKTPYPALAPTKRIFHGLYMKQEVFVFAFRWFVPSRSHCFCIYFGHLFLREIFWGWNGLFERGKRCPLRPSRAIYVQGMEIRLEAVPVEEKSRKSR
jgi:hypothetical protein